MPRLKLTIEYDGTDFVGWQVQPNGRSVQEVVERAASRLLKEEVRVLAAGRTDSGVHALGQVASLWSPMDLPLKAWMKGLNSLLPQDVAVVGAEVVPDDFDPRRWSLSKQYRYLISNRPVRSPLRRRTHWEIFQRLDFEAMTRAAVALEGRHDFSAFRAADCEARNALRNVHRVELQARGDELSITVEGDAFLKHMVRNFVGTLVEVGRGRRPVEWVREVLEGKDRTLAGRTAPPQGLTLMHVVYGLGPRPRREAAVLD